MEKKYNATIEFQNSTTDLYEVTKEEILNTIKTKVENESEILRFVKWELI